MAEQKEKGLRLLALDGGGIRGLSTLYILKMIMLHLKDELKLPKVPLPCEIFDIIGGTSTGGLIALMIGRLRMSVDEAIQAYVKLAKDVFSKPNTSFAPGSKYKESNLEDVVRSIVEQYTGDPEAEIIDSRSSDELCRTFVCAAQSENLNAPSPRLIRTYEPPRQFPLPCTIVKAARATTAAPTFFKPVVITVDGLEQTFIDGGIAANNPSDNVLQEAQLVFPKSKLACIISIGTGQLQRNTIPSEPNFGQRLFPIHVAQAMVAIATDTERQHEVLQHRFKSQPNVYFRFNVEQGLQDVTLEEWNKMNLVRTYTEGYLDGEAIKSRLEEAAKALAGQKATLPVSEAVGSIPATSDTDSRRSDEIKYCPLPTPMFTGRISIINLMQQYFFDGSRKRHLFVLHGLGGHGKSQIVYNFVQICEDAENEMQKFSEVFFIDASSESTILNDLKSIASANGCTHALTWFRQKHTRWLIIFDNADDPTLNLGVYFPQCGHGDILITTRNPEMTGHTAEGVSSYRVSGMLPDEATTLLLRTSRILDDKVLLSESEVAAAASLVQDLGYLALAIVQAGAYIMKTKITIVEYSQLFKQRRGELLEEYQRIVQKSYQYGGTVYATWSVSYQKLTYEAREFLNICAFMHHDRILQTYFQDASRHIWSFAPDSGIPMTGIESKSFERARSFLTTFHDDSGGWDELRFKRVTNDIMSYSLIDFDTSIKSYSFHPLVHEWLRTVILDSELEATRSYSQAFLSLLPYDHDYSSRAMAYHRDLLVHIDQALEKDYGKTGYEIARRVQQVYCTTGRWMEEEKLASVVVERRKRELGQEHLATLSSINDLARIFWRQRKWEDAQRLLLLAVEGRERLLGKEHPDTLTSLSNLSLTYEHQERYMYAEQLQVRVMEARKKVLGENHPDTLTSMANLAITYGYRRHGNWKSAERLELIVLKKRKEVLGENHPDTISSMFNLASTYEAQGRWTEAEALLVSVVEKRKEVLGKDHPDTLKSITDLHSTHESMKWYMAKPESEVQPGERDMVEEEKARKRAKAKRRGFGLPDDSIDTLYPNVWRMDLGDMSVDSKHLDEWLKDASVTPISLIDEHHLDEWIKDRPITPSSPIRVDEQHPNAWTNNLSETISVDSEHLDEWLKDVSVTPISLIDEHHLDEWIKDRPIPPSSPIYEQYLNAWLEYRKTRKEHIDDLLKHLVRASSPVDEEKA